jgi:2'-5' RNA ligase
LHGLVSLLDEKHTRLVEEIWGELNQDCGLTGIQATPYAHFSWQIAADYRWDRVEAVMQEIAALMEPITIKTTGLTVFTGENPVLVVPLIRTAALSQFHALIWRKMEGVGIGASMHYHPQNWVPHITLANYDLTPANLDCAMQKLAFRDLSWEIEVDNLALISQEDVEKGMLHYRFSLGVS